MNFQISDQIELKFFSEDQANSFFSSIHEIADSGDEYRSRLQKKYPQLKDVQARIKDAVNNKYEKDGTPDFFIYYNSKLVGIFEFAPLQSESDFVEVGYWLYSEFRRKGILSSIFPSMIKYAKENFHRDRLIATTPLDNHPSQKLLEKCGFRNTGRIEEFKKDHGEVERDVEYEVLLK